MNKIMEFLSRLFHAKHFYRGDAQLIGILAYGSLINEPGDEIKGLIVDRIEKVRTPFKVEFARSSDKRGGAPTLVPVANGGARIKAAILILSDAVSREEAVNMLWRRETHKPVGSTAKYNPLTPPGEKTVLIDDKPNFYGLGTVLYTRIAANIANLTSASLASLAIQSAQSKEVQEGKDGISYLLSAKQYGITTPLTKKYEKEILRQTNTKSLEEAFTKVRP